MLRPDRRRLVAADEFRRSAERLGRLCPERDLVELITGTTTSFARRHGAALGGVLTVSPDRMAVGRSSNDSAHANGAVDDAGRRASATTENGIVLAEPVRTGRMTLRGCRGRFPG